MPACSRQLLRGKRIRNAVDLTALPLLQKNAREDAWTRWFEAAGCDDLEHLPIKGSRYDLFSMLIQAACCGIGVALVPRLYIDDELKSGRLVIPLEVSVRGLKQYCVIYPDHKDISPTVQRFLEWLVAVAKRPAAGGQGTTKARTQRPVFPNDQ